jgi:D-sedoheptulose 7-phosphate isomerase
MTIIPLKTKGNMHMKKTVADRIETHKKLIARFESKCIESIITIARTLIKCLKAGGCIYICGNGGSAADAQHIASELVGRFERERKGLPAIALTTDTSALTSIANDYGFEHIFSRQVEALVGPNDILWAISTSGTSANVIAAAKSAKQKKATVVAFTGKANTTLEDISDVCISIDAPNTASAQEIHQLAYHIICDLVEAQMCQN